MTRATCVTTTLGREPGTGASHFAVQPQVLVLRRAGGTDEKALIDGVEIAGKVGAPE